MHWRMFLDCSAESGGNFALYYDKGFKGHHLPNHTGLCTIGVRMYCSASEATAAKFCAAA